MAKNRNLSIWSSSSPRIDLQKQGHISGKRKLQPPEGEISEPNGDRVSQATRNPFRKSMAKDRIPIIGNNSSPVPDWKKYNDHILKKRKLESAEGKASGPNPNENGASNSLTKSDLWFDDGNLVIQAENTQFRVHLGMLTRNSWKFKEIVAASTEAWEGEENVPLVRMSGSAGDVHHLLHSLYDSTYLLKFYRGKKGRFPFSLLMALIRLGDKYGFEQLRDEAAKRVYKEYPFRMDQWNKLDRTGPTLKLHYLDAEGCPAFTLRLLMLAIECNMLTVLPQIYLEVYLKFSWDSIVNGVQCHDGTTFTLPPSVQVTCLLGFHRLRDKISQVTYSWFQDLPYENCLSSAFKTEGCKKGKGRLYYDIFGPKKQKVEKPEDEEEDEDEDEGMDEDEGEGEPESDPDNEPQDSDSKSVQELEMSLTQSLSQRGSVGSGRSSQPKKVSSGKEEESTWVSGWESWNDKWTADLCTPCAKAAKEEHNEGREKLWGMLPELFGLPKWDDLEDFE